MFRLLHVLIVGVLVTLAAPGYASDCSPAQFDRAVDEAGDKLRAANTKSENAMRRDFVKLAKLKGWPKDGAVERGFEFLQDEQTRTLDQQASELLIRLDLLSDTDKQPANCQRLGELKQAVGQLLEVTAAKRSHVQAKLAVAINPKLKQTAKASGNEQSQTALRPSAFPKPPENSRNKVATKPKPSAQPKSKPAPKSGAHWSTRTTIAPPPSQETMASLPPPVMQQQDLTFSSQDIRLAGRGLFGTLSAELAAVIKFAFDAYGKPNAYVLGSEGGAAFLAGLRYGKGRLISKQFEPRTLFWQGPSIGTDFGITGSRVMVLVYNLDDADQIYRRFVGVEGAAYLVGGVGITFHKKGRMVLAPIRTGVGLRLGANVGYLKITPRRTLNPF